jgi:hypothetical protein
MVVAAAVD